MIKGKVSHWLPLIHSYSLSYPPPVFPFLPHTTYSLIHSRGFICSLFPSPIYQLTLPLDPSVRLRACHYTATGFTSSMKRATVRAARSPSSLQRARGWERLERRAKESAEGQRREPWDVQSLGVRDDPMELLSPPTPRIERFFVSRPESTRPLPLRRSPRSCVRRRANRTRPIKHFPKQNSSTLLFAGLSLVTEAKGDRGGGSIGGAHGRREPPCRAPPKTFTHGPAKLFSAYSEYLVP